MRSEVAIAEAIALYIRDSGRMKRVTAAKKCAVPRNTSGRKAAEYSDDNRNLVAYKRNSALGFANEKFTQHTLKLRHIRYGLTLVERKRTVFQIRRNTWNSY